MGRFYVGLVVETYIKDGLGNTKARPAVVVDLGDPRIPDDDLQVIAITGSIENPCPSYHIKLGYEHGMSKPCVAKCNWVRSIRPNKIIKTYGTRTIPDDLLEQILASFRVLCNDPLFHDWM